jgi:hypothetical protein
MTGSKVQFLPFSAINMFMRPDYRLEVVRKVFNLMPESPEEVRATFNRYIKKFVAVPGFRNSSAAPVSLKIKPYISAFESQPEVAAFTMATWARGNRSLLDKVFDLLTDREWELLPKDADRTQLPGFLTTWPKDESFEAVNKAFKEKYTEETYHEDDISLMAVWLSGRLPYQEEDPDKE